MRHSTRSTRPRRLLTIGLIALAVANVATYIIQRKLALPEHIADPLSGFLMGTAIALMFLGIMAQAKAMKNGAREK
jgi:hypothetical protein